MVLTSSAPSAAPPGRAAAHRPAPRRRGLVLAGAVGLVLLAALLSLAVGSRPLDPVRVVQALLAPDGSTTSLVVRDLRVPRTVVGTVVGMALGLAGAQLQGLTRNPLADPGLLGVSAGAALAVVATSTVLGIGGSAGQALAAVVGALGATAAVWVLAGSRRGASPLPLVLAGVALTALLTSVTTVLVLLDADTLDEYRFWAVGSLAGREVAQLLPVAPLLFVGAALAAACARTLDALALGEDLARGLGTRLAWGQGAVAVSATLLTAAAVAVAGPLGFVGLVVPHVARALVGPAHRWLLPLSALLGAVLLLTADVLGRVVARPGEVQVGIVTALVGAPFLLALVGRRGGAAA
jgi:iron complex transport system permease protein